MISTVFSVLMLAASPSATAPVAAPAPAATPKPERKICRREMTSESRLGGKQVCLTSSEWKARNIEVRGLSDHSK